MKLSVICIRTAAEQTLEAFGRPEQTITMAALNKNYEL
jgi:hypothetical protein